MTAQRITNFTGTTPKLDPRNIPEVAGQQATNVFLTSGRLDPMLKPLKITTTRSSAVKTIYKIYGNNASHWLSWNEQVDIAESPVYVVNNSRIAFASPSFEPRQTDYTLATSATPYPAQWYVLGVTPPLSAPVFSSVSGGSGATENRSYVYTFVTKWGEESAPSAPMSIQTQFLSGTWNITLPDVAPANSYSILAAAHASGVVTLTLDTTFGLRALECITFNGVLGMTDVNNLSFRIKSVNNSSNQVTISLTTSQTYISGGVATRDAPHNVTGMLKRVYRTVTTTTGTNYYQVGSDITAATTTFADNHTVIGGQLVTSGWAMPPADLTGLVTHPSGSVVGFVGNQMYMSMPYSIYAWPTAQTNTLDYPIVGLGVTGQSIVVCTEGRPYTVTFSDPAAASAQKIDQDWPCLSKQGIVQLNKGVFFPTTLGLACVGGLGVTLVTETMFAQRDWAKLKPSTFIGSSYDSMYYAFYDDGIAQQIMMISPSIGVTHINQPLTAMHKDSLHGEVFVAYDGFIYQLNANIGVYAPYLWQSKEFVLPNPVNLGACKVDYNGTSSKVDLEALDNLNIATRISNQAVLSGVLGTQARVNGTALNTIAIDGSNLDDLHQASSMNSGYYISLSLFANGELIFNTQVTSPEVFRLPAGLKYDNYSVMLTGTAPVKSVVLGGTPLSLKEA